MEGLKVTSFETDENFLKVFSANSYTRPDWDADTPDGEDPPEQEFEETSMETVVIKNIISLDVKTTTNKTKKDTTTEISVCGKDAWSEFRGAPEQMDPLISKINEFIAQNLTT